MGQLGVQGSTLRYLPWSSESSCPVLLSFSDPGPPTKGGMSPGANELLFASGVAPACTPPGCWCFSPVVVAVVLVLLSSSSSSSVPEPSSDSANGVGNDTVCCCTVGYDACDVSDEPAACISVDYGGSRFF